MKKRKTIVLVFLILLLQINAIETVAGVDFLTESEDEKTSVRIEQMSKKIRVLHDVPSKAYIECFDVNENGMIVVGTGIFAQKKIAVYNSNGTYQYGFSFYSTGAYGLGWKNENVLVYSLRENLVTEINAKGEVVSVLKIKETDDIDKRWHYVQYSKKKNIKNNTYICKGSSKIIRIDESGSQTVVYSVSPAHIIITVVILVLLVVSVVGTVVFFVFRILRFSKHKKI